MALYGHGAGLVAILANLVLKINAVELAGEMFWFGPGFYDGPVEQALFGDDTKAKA